MRKLLLFAFLLLTTLVRADGVQVTTFGATGNGVAITNIGSGVAFHKLTWTVSGTVSTCTIAIDSSTDGSSWNNGDVVAAQNCTSNGTATSISFVANYTRVRVITFIGTGTVAANYNLYVNNPSSGGVAGADTQVQFNDGMVMGANAAFTFNKTTGTLTVGSGPSLIKLTTGACPSGAASTVGICADTGDVFSVREGNTTQQPAVLTNKTNTFGSSGKIDLSAAAGATGLKVPVAAGAAPVTSGTIAFDSTANMPVFGGPLGGSASTGTQTFTGTLFSGINTAAMDSNTCTGHPICVWSFSTSSGALNNAGAIVFPANFWTVGKTVIGHFTVQAVGSGAAITQFLQFRFATGPVVLLTTVSGVSPGNTTTRSYGGTFVLTCTATGASGKIAFSQSAANGWTANWANSTTQPVTVDTTVAQTFQPVANFASSSAGDTQQLIFLALIGLN